jgi:hypothetical protein
MLLLSLRSRPQGLMFVYPFPSLYDYISICVHLAHHSSFDFFILNLSSLKHCRPILTEFKTTKEFEKRQSSSDVFFVFVKDESEQSGEYKVLSYYNLNLQPCRSLNSVLIIFLFRKLFK